MIKYTSTVIAYLYWWGKLILEKVDVGVVSDAGKVAEWKEAVAYMQWTLQTLVNNQ